MTNIVCTIKKAFNNLIGNRFFVSEADFQHTFAMELEKTFINNPNIKILLEFPIKCENRKVHVDIMVCDGCNLYPIELKYKTCSISLDKPYENTNIKIKDLLKTHGAQDLGGYDFWKDIHRIETLIKEGSAISGVCIFLTNDPYYKEGKYKNGTQASNFRIGTGYVRKGKKIWHRDNKNITPSYIIKHPEFNIYNDYDFQWKEDFYQIKPEIKNGQFMSLFVEIPSKNKE